MPFTLSHPAAVIPLRRHLPLSALVVGSLSPDFEYPFRLAAVSRFSHSLPGILYFCVPAGLVLLWLFHRLLKRPSILLLPPDVRHRVGPPEGRFNFWPAGRLLLILFALFVGALSHVWWDAFTHEYGWAVARWPALQSVVVAAGGHELRLYKLLQHAGSVAGLLLTLYFFWRWLRRQPYRDSPQSPSLPESVRRGAVALILLLTCAGAVGLGLWSAARESGLYALQVFVVQAAVGGMLTFAVFILLYSLLLGVALPRMKTR
jgi:hypothetical protein